MLRNRKCLVFFLAALAIVNLAILHATSAQTTPKPFVPEFSVKFIKASYTTVDPYTGASQQIDNSTIQITIRKQPFQQLHDNITGATTSLYYNIQEKGHFAQGWTDIFDASSNPLPSNPFAPTPSNLLPNIYPIQSDSDYSIVILNSTYPQGGNVDFRIQAFIANATLISVPNFIPNPFRGGDYTYATALTIVQTSDWSSAQTITIADGSISSSISDSTYPTLTPTPTTLSPTPTVPEFQILAILPLFLSLLSAAVVLRHRKKPNLKQ